MSVALARATAARQALAYLELTKPRITSLVVFTALPALLLASRGLPPLGVVLGTLLGIACSSASASCFNMYFDMDVDALMRRTASRPLPAGLLPPSSALGLGFVMAGFAWVVLIQFANLLAAAIAMASIFYYAIVYTVWLKRRTPQNIVIGGAAGSSAPLIAWAAVTGQVALPAVLLAAIVFLWTPPHFWALSLYRRDDYARAGLPMLPLTHGEAETRRQILIYSLLLVPVTLLPWSLRLTGAVYGVPAAVLGAAFVLQAARLWRGARTADAVRLFRYSILYLFLVYVLMTVDSALRLVPGR